MIQIYIWWHRKGFTEHFLFQTNDLCIPSNTALWQHCPYSFLISECCFLRLKKSCQSIVLTSFWSRRSCLKSLACRQTLGNSRVITPACRPTNGISRESKLQNVLKTHNLTRKTSKLYVILDNFSYTFYVWWKKIESWTYNWSYLPYVRELVFKSDLPQAE